MVKRSYRQRSRKRTRTKRRVSRNRISKKTRNYRKRRSGRRARNRSRKKSRIYKNMRGGAEPMMVDGGPMMVEGDHARFHDLLNIIKENVDRLMGYQRVAGSRAKNSKKKYANADAFLVAKDKKSGPTIMIACDAIVQAIFGLKRLAEGRRIVSNMFTTTPDCDPSRIIDGYISIILGQPRKKKRKLGVYITTKLNIAATRLTQSETKVHVSKLADDLAKQLNEIKNEAELSAVLGVEGIVGAAITPLAENPMTLPQRGLFYMIRFLNSEDVETLQFFNPPPHPLDLCGITTKRHNELLQLRPANYLLSTKKKNGMGLTDSARLDDRENMVHKYLQGEYGREPRNKHGIHGFSLYDFSKAGSSGSLDEDLKPLLDEMRKNFRVFAEKRIVGGTRPSDGARSLFITAFRGTETEYVREVLGSSYDVESGLQSTAQIRGGALEGGDFNSVFTSPPEFVDGGHQASVASNPESTDNTEASLNAFRIVPKNGIKYARLGRLMGQNNVNPTEINFIGDGLIRGYHISLLDEYKSGIVTSPDILKVYEQVFNIDLYGQRFWKPL